MSEDTQEYLRFDELEDAPLPLAGFYSGTVIEPPPHQTFSALDVAAALGLVASATGAILSGQDPEPHLSPLMSILDSKGFTSHTSKLRGALGGFKKKKGLGLEKSARPPGWENVPILSLDQTPEITPPAPIREPSPLSLLQGKPSERMRPPAAIPPDLAIQQAKAKAAASTAPVPAICVSALSAMKSGMNPRTVGILVAKCEAQGGKKFLEGAQAAQWTKPAVPKLGVAKGVLTPQAQMPFMPPPEMTPPAPKAPIVWQGPFGPVTLSGERDLPLHSPSTNMAKR